MDNDKISTISIEADGSKSQFRLDDENDADLSAILPGEKSSIKRSMINPSKSNMGFEVRLTPFRNDKDEDSGEQKKRQSEEEQQQLEGLWTFSANREGELESGASVSFEIVYDSESIVNKDQEGSYGLCFELYNTTIGRVDVSFNVFVSVGTPRLLIEPANTLDLGIVQVSSKISKSFLITNAGSGPLRYSVSDFISPQDVSSLLFLSTRRPSDEDGADSGKILQGDFSEMILNPSDSIEFFVTFTPEVEAKYQATL